MSALSRRPHLVSTLVVATALLGAPAASQAAKVDFEDVGNGMSTNFSSAGFDFALHPGFGDISVRNEQFCTPACPFDGTSSLYALYGQSSVTMSKSGGGVFDLLGFDGAGSFNVNEFGPGWLNTGFIDVVGTTAGGGTVAQSFALDQSAPSGPLAFRSFTLDGSFVGLTSVTFSSSGPGYDYFHGFTLDNIAVSAVPEPPASAFALAGLCVVGATLRRRRG